jgi:hypothetical protein
LEFSELKDKITESPDAERSNKWIAIYISVLAVLLAVGGLGGTNAMKEVIDANISASDTYAFYQSKNIRQTGYRIAAEELDSLILSRPDLADTARKPIEQRIERYRQRVEEYESDPKTGEGKKELLQKARDFEVLRDTRQRQDRYFDYAEALLQIAIVLASVSIVTGMLGVRLLSYAMAGIGVVLLFDAFTLSFAIPFL